MKYRVRVVLTILVISLFHPSQATSAEQVSGIEWEIRGNENGPVKLLIQSDRGVMCSGERGQFICHIDLLFELPSGLKAASLKDLDRTGFFLYSMKARLKTFPFSSLNASKTGMLRISGTYQIMPTNVTLNLVQDYSGGHYDSYLKNPNSLTLEVGKPLVGNSRFPRSANYVFDSSKGDINESGETDGLWINVENRDPSLKCKFGFEELGNEIFCYQIQWEENSDSDGFSTAFSVSIDSGDDEFDTGGYSNLEIICSAKKLSVKVYLKYPSSFGWKGTGQYRFDSGPGKKFTYRVDRSFDSFWLDNPKAFTSAFLKAKNKASFKVSNQYLRILVFPKSNLNYWAPKFKALGCPLD